MTGGWSRSTRKNLKVSSEEKVLEMMRALDKVAKKTEDELVREYMAKGVGETEMRALLSFGRTTGTPDRVMAVLEEAGLTGSTAAEGGLGELRDSLKLRGVANVEYNLSIVRGIDYYTAIVFEVADGVRPDLGSLCGGGRYDVLPRIFGRPELSATGAAGGVERIALCSDRDGTLRPRPTSSTRTRRLRGTPSVSCACSGMRASGATWGCAGGGWASSSRTQAPGVSTTR